MSKVSIKINDLSKSYGARVILDKIRLDLSPGARTALVGLNGCGKSTLLKILAGLDFPDKGSFRVLPGGSVGYLPQLVTMGKSTLGEFLEKAAAAGWNREQWQLDAAVGQVIKQVGLEEVDRNIPARLLSGGQKTRAYLGRLMLEGHDYLLLDEPTNYLDIAGLAWLEELLSGLDSGILMVSHDRYFLDRAADRVVELENGSLAEYVGGYTNYRREKAERAEKQWHQFKAQKKEIRRMEEFVRREKSIQTKIDNSTVNDFVRSRAKRHGVKARAMERRIDRMEKVDAPRQNFLARVRFQGKAASRVVARASELSMAFGNNRLYDGVNFEIGSGEKVGIIGPNGSGKTTLLNLLMGRLEPVFGKAFLLSGDQAGYFSQVFEDLDPDRPVLDQVMDSTGLDKHQARQLLASFLFFGEDVFRRVGTLSVGERSRVALSCLAALEPQVLILDEPTNHLDVDTTEILEQALMDFSGAVIVVTHDRFLLDRLARRVLVIEDKKVDSYQGNYSYYVEKKQRLESARSPEKTNALDRDRKLLLQVRLSGISAMLSRQDVSPKERESLGREFDEIKRELDRDSP